MTRWRILHNCHSHSQVAAQAKYGVKVKIGSIVDTEKAFMIATYVFFVESKRVKVVLNRGERLTGSQWVTLRAAVRAHYTSGHFARKPAKRQKPSGRPWTPDTAPKPLPAPRIARIGHV